jgi:Flp pilus assembly protein TadD
VPISRWQYLISESGVLLHYLGLAFWPRPLCLDYQWPLATSLGSVWLQCVVVVALLAVTAWCLWRHPVVGFLAASFFIILAPTSSIMPIVDLAFEHRMYLALAPVLVLAVFGLDRLITSLTADTNLGHVLALGAGIVAACSLGVMTSERNRNYETDVAIWQSTVKARPSNLRARFNLAEALIAKNRFAEAEEELRRVIERDPRHVYAHTDMGLLLDARGLTDEAISHFRAALGIDEHHYKARSGLGNALRHQGRLEEAIAELRAVAHDQPGYFPASLHLAQALADKHEEKEALEWYEKTARAQADPSALLEELNALNKIAWVLATSPDEKRRDGQRAVTIAEGLCRITEQRQPQFLDTLAAAYAEAGRFDDAEATALHAEALVSSSRSKADLSARSEQLDRYRKHLPFRDSSLGSDSSNQSPQ